MHAGVIINLQPGIGVPFTVATEAAKLGGKIGLSKKTRKRNSFEDRDQVWAVFDRDEHPRYEEAINLCRKAGVSVARSNPCFEVWLILHKDDFNRPDGRSVVQRELRRLCPEYDPDRGKCADCDKLMNLVEAAERRAAAQLRRRESEGAPFGSPSTTVHTLTIAIREAVTTRK
jgi:hypothetical protein